MPIHVEGSTAWKEIQAVGDFLMESNTHGSLFRELLTSKPLPEEHANIFLQTGESHKNAKGIASHHHDVSLTSSEVSKLKAGGNVTGKVTSEINGHQHTITIKWHKNQGFYIALCASTPEITRSFAYKCLDRHPAVLTVDVNA